MPGVAGRRFERRAAACVPDRLREKKSGHEGQRTHIYPHPFRPSSVRGPGRRFGWGGGKESACASRCGGAGWAGIRDPYLPPMPPTSIPSPPVFSALGAMGGFAHKMSTLGVGDGEMGDGGCAIFLSSTRGWRGWIDGQEGGRLARHGWDMMSETCRGGS